MSSWPPVITAPSVVTERSCRRRPARPLAIAQDVFESVLQSHVQAHDIARVRMGTELIGLEMRPDDVLATVPDRASGRSSAVSAGYVVAADGARSTVRDLLGIGLDGAEDLGSQHGIAFRADLTRYTGAVPRGRFFLTSSGAALFSTHPDNRWAVSVPDLGEPLDPEATVRRCTGIADLQVEVALPPHSPPGTPPTGRNPRRSHHANPRPHKLLAHQHALNGCPRAVPLVEMMKAWGYRSGSRWPTGVSARGPALLLFDQGDLDGAEKALGHALAAFDVSRSVMNGAAPSCFSPLCKNDAVGARWRGTPWS